MIKKDDIVDLYIKLQQRGLSFLSSKLTTNELERTKSAFNDDALFAAHWWIIPEVKSRWNEMITGTSNQSYEHYFINEFLQDEKNLKMLSLGSGVCSHEMELAKYNCFENITCVDISNKLIQKAELEAKTKGLNNMTFKVGDVYKLDLPQDGFDIIFFHASLHHFENIAKLFEKKLDGLLKPNGLVVINEYVGPNRMQYPKHQIDVINKAIKVIPDIYKQRHKTQLTKRAVSGPGKWRMIIADPSECVDSAAILPSLRSRYKTVVERPYGGNILMYALKDISHHFTSLDADKQAVLQKLFDIEDEYLKQNESNFIFAIYQKQ